MRYRKISISEKVYNELVRLRDEKGFSSISDTVEYLVHVYLDFIDRISSILATTSSTPATPGSTDATQSSKYATQGSTGATTGSISATQSSIGATQARKRRPTIREVLAREKVQFLSEINPRNPEAFIAKARREGVVVLEGEDDTALVDPDFYNAFIEKVGGLDEPSPEKVIGKLEGAEKRVFEFMYRNGLVYYSDGGWKLVE